MKAKHATNYPRYTDPRYTDKDRSLRGDQSSRGSALLIVIGTLALVAVFAAVYISIGRTDRRAANSVLARKDQQDSSTEFAEYISSIIGQDRLDAFVQYPDVGTAGFAKREVTDAPYTDWTRRSEGNPADPFNIFTPTGRILSLGSLGATGDLRVASDPWLASTTPVYLGNPGSTAASVPTRPFSTYEIFNAVYPNAKNFLDNRDWLQLSNFAPDGRFVNLFNLRPNRAFGDPVVGRFNAEPGTGLTTQADGRNVRRMSEYLSLFRKDTDLPDSLIRAFDPSIDGVWVPGRNNPVVLPGIADVFNTPAVWTMYQRFMFMPINQPFVTLNRNGVISTWADPDYPSYQYGDADGDGMADSRWIELVSAIDRTMGTNSAPRDDVKTLYNNKDYRYFIAARAVDLSSMVNVNTATDLLVPPTRQYPLGLTPADVDLRRLLTMQDPAGEYTAVNNSEPLSFAQLHRPFVGNNEPPYGPWRPSQASGWAARNLNRNVTDYWVYKHEFDRGGAAPDLRLIESDSSAMLIGRYAYEALRMGITLGGSLSDLYEGYDLDFPAPNNPRALAQYERDPKNYTQVPIPQITPQKRYEQYLETGLLDPTDRGVSWTRGTDYGSGLYGLDDLVELLTFFGLNDPEVTSRLERVTNGRYQSPGGDTLQTQRFGPLMSNRPLSLDRGQHGYALTNINANPSTPPNIDNPNYRQVNGRISFNSMAHFALTPRTKLTTISGAVPLSPTEPLFDPLAPAQWDPSVSIALSDGAKVESFSGLFTDTNKLFDAYSGALAGELNIPNSASVNSSGWVDDPTLFRGSKVATAFYGHRGPELALHVAAHAAVNMKDLADNDTDPTVATIIVDNQPRTGLTNTNNFNTPGSDSLYQLYPGVADGNLFDPGQPNIGSVLTSTQRQAVNVYGMEAMPIITEVSVLYAFTDASESAGGDPDYTVGIEPSPQGTGLVRYPAPGEADEITIDGTVTPGNNDYLIQVLAFQLHNPYDHSISLGGTGQGGATLAPDAPLTRQRRSNNTNQIDQQSNYQFDYYIEFAGRFYKVAKYIEWYPTIRNAEGATYNALDRPSTDIALGTVTNPTTGIPGTDGGRMDPGTGGAQATYSDFITRNVVLGPQETRVFYVIADKRFDGAIHPDEKWVSALRAYNGLPQRFDPANIDPLVNDTDRDNLIDGWDGRGWTGPAEEWVEHQFKVRGNQRPVMMMEFDPRDGYLLNEEAFRNPLDPSGALLPGTGRNDATEVRLWKKIVTKGEETDDINIPAGERTLRNVVDNDLLADRMKLESTLDLTLTTGDIANTVSYREDFPSTINGIPVRNDNTGITIAKWKTQRRADSNELVKPDIGSVGPWMLRSRRNLGATRIMHPPTLPPDTYTATEIFEGNNLDDPSVIPTIRGDFEIQKTLRAFLNLATDANAHEIVQTIALDPWFKSDVTTVGVGGIGGFEDDNANNSATKFPIHPLVIGGVELKDRTTQILTSGNQLSTKTRLADLLLVWGIGPSYAPLPTRAANSTEYVAEEWMTAPEAMAIALGVDTAPPVAPFSDADAIWRGTYNPAIPPAKDDNLLDNGHLVIDNFVSYLNQVPESPPLPPKFTPGIGGVGGDIPRGTGVPMALGVIDQARAIVPPVQITDPVLGTATPDEQLRIDLGRPTLGTININTAPVEVLRLLPGLTPSRAKYFDGPGSEVNEWWWSQYPNTNLPSLSTSDIYQNPDVASAIVAYRDRTYGVPVTASRVDAYGVNFYDAGPMNFEPTDINLVSNNMKGEFPLVTLPTGNGPMDRSSMTGIDGIRPTPGFGSLGELLAVRVDPDFETTSTTRWSILKHLSIEQYGHDDIETGIATGPDGDVTIISQLFNGRDPGKTIDDYAEKISMANAVLNTLSVRSDYFAVWFVVHGYQESDVANLRPEDPLIPSIKKRYLMVVDRSNVIEPSDQPKILVFKELPL